MWRDRGQGLGAVAAVATGVADAATRTSATLAIIVIGTAALVMLWWYLVRRSRRRD